MPDLAAVIERLKAADSESELTAALANAKANGFSNKHEAFKHAKRRLYSLNTGEALELLLAKEAAKKRKRSWEEDQEELKALASKAAKASKGIVEVVSGAIPRETKKEKRKKQKTEAWEAGDTAEQPEVVPVVEKRKRTKDNVPKFQVRVAGFPFSEEEEALKEAFENCGDIAELELIKDKMGRSRAVAFISFISEMGVKNALKMDGDPYGKRHLKVSLPKSSAAEEFGEKEEVEAKPVKKDASAFQLFVGGLAYTAEEEAVKKLFTDCGEVESFFMPTNRAGKKKWSDQRLCLGHLH